MALLSHRIEDQLMFQSLSWDKIKCEHTSEGHPTAYIRTRLRDTYALFDCRRQDEQPLAKSSRRSCTANFSRMTATSTSTHLHGACNQPDLKSPARRLATVGSRMRRSCSASSPASPAVSASQRAHAAAPAARSPASPAAPAAASIQVMCGSDAATVIMAASCCCFLAVDSVRRQAQAA